MASVGVCSALLLGGCRQTQAVVRDAPIVRDDGSLVRIVYKNPFEPVTVLLTPHTALVPNAVGTGTRIEAYFELHDQHGDPVKALGEATFELYTTDIDGEEVQARRWRLDLNNLDNNRDSYDRIVRAYRATLDDVPDSGSGAMRLELRYTPADGARLTSSRRLR